MSVLTRRRRPSDPRPGDGRPGDGHPGDGHPGEVRPPGGRRRAGTVPVVRPTGRRARRGLRARPPAAPRPPVPPGPALVSSALTLLAVLVGWALVQVLVLGGLSEARAQQGLYAGFREALAAQTAPLGGTIAPGTPVALLSVPTLGLEQVVVEGTASGDLQAGPGHRRDTVLPGQQGISVVYGKALTYGAPFRSVPRLQAGDGIEVTTAQGEFTYRVDGVRRAGDPTPAAPATGGSRLTLVTVEGSGLLGGLAPDRTVYVDATLVEDAAVGAPGRPAAVPDAEKALAGDAGVLPILVLAVQALLVAVGAVAWARWRVAGRVLWVLGAPVVMAAAWFAVDLAASLLPNLL